MRSPGSGARRRAGKAAAASCTHQAPSAKPGSSRIGVRSSSRTLPVGRTMPPSRSAQASGSVFTVRSTDAAAACPAATARARPSP